MLMTIALLAALADPQAGKPARDGGERAADSADKMICKRFVETGSLVRGYRTCKTKAEWERDRDFQRQSIESGPGCAAGSAQGSACGH